MSVRCSGLARALLSSAAFTLFAPATLHAQAWVPPQGEGSVSVLYQHLYIRDHLFSGGLRRDVGHIRAQSLTADFDYGLTDRLSLRTTLPFVAARYRGPSPHRHADGETLDDGTYHAGFQDLRFNLRYSLIDFPVAVTPFVAVTVPSHDYEFFAHSAIGLGLREIQFGAYAGVARERFYVQGRYSYGVFERVIGLRRTRSNIDTEAGWFVHPRLRVFAMQLGQISHSGIEIFPGFVGLNPEEIHHHDQVGRANILDIGGGVSVALTPTLGLTGSVVRTRSGSNTHMFDYAVTIGASWSLTRRSHSTHGSASQSAHVPVAPPR